MLRLINPGSILPKKYLVEPTGLNIPHFEPGMMAQITGQSASGQDICGRYRCGLPIGIIDDIRNQKDDTTAITRRITIWECGIEGETDMFEPLDTYVVGGCLGVSPNGLFATNSSIHLPHNSAIAGIVSISHHTYNGYFGKILGFRWFGIGNKTPINSQKSLKKNILSCSKCHTLNEYAIPNQDDGSFICCGCRLGF